MTYLSSNFGHLSKSELDHIALQQAGFVGSITSEKDVQACRDEALYKTAHGYYVRAVDNGTKIILSAYWRTTTEVLERGRVLYLELRGFTTAQAKSICWLPRVMEDDVIDFVLEELCGPNVELIWGTFPDTNKNATVKKWLDKHKVKTTMPIQKVKSAAMIIAALL